MKESSATVASTTSIVPPKVVDFDFGDDPVNFEDSVSVNCLISSGDMPVEIIWLLNNNAMDSYYGSGVNIMKSGKRASVLTIDAVHAGHVGNYTCLAKNRAGQASHSAKLIVNVPPKISPFSTGSEAVHLGHYITYQCTISEGDIPLNILWTLNNQPLFNDDNDDILIVKMGRRSSVLTIESVTARNAGNYTCQGSNKAGKASYTVQLRVIVLPRIRPFSFEDGPAQTGQYISLSCSATNGDLPLNITWFLNSEEVNESHGITTMMVNRRTSVLTIESVDDRHAGNFTCLARNPAGHQHYTTQLNIYGAALNNLLKVILVSNILSPRDGQVFIYLVEVSNKYYGMASRGANQRGRVLRKDFTIEERESIVRLEIVLPKIAPFNPGAEAFFPGDYFTLQCSIIHGDHPMLIYWYFNQRQLNDAHAQQLGIEISKMGSRSSVLTIESVKGNHAGNYTCFGKNSAGVTNYTASLIVNVPPKLAPLPSSGDSPLYVGDYFQLSCAVVHGDAPFNITWFYNDEPVNKLDGITILMQSKRSSSLNIESVRGEHAGKYTCMGANRAGATEVFTHLIVKELPQLEQFHFNANGVNGGQAVRVMCMVISGDLPIDIHWLKNGQPLLRSIYHKIDEYTLILSLRQTNIGDSGNYTCVATNAAGEARKWSILKVKVRPFQHILRKNSVHSLGFD
uniref:Ig-like domain-containing protein n=1 Tax=Glossina austeni TaxID=7395 RepID=A0A1A9V525_GLOAU